MATLSTQKVVRTGLNPTYAAAAGGGDKLTPGENVFLHVKNAGGGSITVTIDDPNSKAPAGAAAFNPDLSVSVPNGGERMIGPLEASRFAGSDGLVAITYSGVSSVTVAAIQV